MVQLDVKNIADKADMIVNGYAFTKEGDYIRVLNLNCLNHAAVIYDNQVIETNMNDIESRLSLTISMPTESLCRLQMPKYYEFKVCATICITLQAA